MQFWELFLIAVSLSMDAFAVAVCKGLILKKITLRHCITIGLYFGAAQALMPLIGYLLASTAICQISDYSFYIAFGLLVLIGLNMIWEAVREEEPSLNNSLSFKAMLPLALATSIDALAIGVSFALIEVRILPAVSLIGTATFFLSAAGTRLGGFAGGKFQKTAPILGGLVLILMGIKILLEGLRIW